MLPFFRRIRKQILGEGRFAKYLAYAIGEIILVVIGILIALQINSWNAKKQERREELRILQNLKTDLINDTLQLYGHLDFASERREKMDSIYLALLYPDSFSTIDFILLNYTLAYTGYFEVNSGTFDESLSASSLKLIRNNDLRQQIFEYYRKAQVSFTDEHAIEQVYSNVFPEMFETLSTTQEFFATFLQKPTHLPGINIRGLAQDKQYLAAVNQKYASESTQISSWKVFLKNAKDLLQGLEGELQKLKD